MCSRGELGVQKNLAGSSGGELSVQEGELGVQEGRAGCAGGQSWMCTSREQGVQEGKPFVCSKGEPFVGDVGAGVRMGEQSVGRRAG